MTVGDPACPVCEAHASVPLPVRLALAALFRVARRTGGENRLFVIARASAAPIA